MGRPGRPVVGLFTSRETAIAAGLTARNFALLAEQGLAPDSAEDLDAGSGGGKAGHRMWDAPGLAHAALIGALNQAGLELLVAARLARSFAEHFGDHYGKLPSNLISYVRSDAGKTWRPWRDQPQDTPVDLDNDVWLHDQLRRHADFYAPGRAVRGDFVIDIADQTYVTIEYFGLEALKTFSPVSGSLPFSMEFRIVGRGPDARIAPVHEEVDDCDFQANPVSAAQLRALEKAYVQGRENAVARLRVNMSLAIRNAFDRVFDARRPPAEALGRAALSPL